MKFFSVKMPFVHSRRSTDDVMNNVLVGLLLIGAYTIGSYYWLYSEAHAVKAFLMILVGALTAGLTEYVFYRYIEKVEHAEVINKIKKSYPAITGIIFTLTLPIGTPLWVIFLGAFLGVFVGKLLFGGFGFNVFNPALVGRIFTTFAWTNMLANNMGSSIEDKILLNIFNTTDSIAGATPLAYLKDLGGVAVWSDLVERTGGVWDLLLGFYPSALGEPTSWLLILVGIYLIVTRTIDVKITFSILITVFLSSWLVGSIHGLGIMYPLFHLLSGGVLFGAIFLATDPVTSPVSRNGKVIYGISIGLITVLIRLAGTFNEGVMFAILFMNMLTPLINDRAMTYRVQTRLFNYTVIGAMALVALGSAFYASTRVEFREGQLMVGTAALIESIDESSAEILDKVVDGNLITYTVSAQGFSNPLKTVITVDTDTMTIVELVITEINDTPSVGNQTQTDETFLGQFVGLKLELESQVDVMSGASYSSRGVFATVKAVVLDLMGGNE
jgi:electron transport complex protein RnfD